jgi:hypothetical protein
VALTEGYQAAFLVAFGIALLGATLALLMRREGETEDAAIKATEAIAPCPPARASAVPAVEVGRVVDG